MGSRKCRWILYVQVLECARDLLPEVPTGSYPGFPFEVALVPLRILQLGLACLSPRPPHLPTTGPLHDTTHAYRRSRCHFPFATAWTSHLIENVVPPTHPAKNRAKSRKLTVSVNGGAASPYVPLWPGDGARAIWKDSLPRPQKKPPMTRNSRSKSPNTKASMLISRRASG